MSSIIGRFLNYLLVPLYTAKLSAESGGYGIVTNIYAITALLLVLLTYGMETGFFRFANKSEEDAQTVYSTTLLSVGSTSILFIVLCLFFLNPIASFLEYGSHPEFVAMMAIVVGMDAFQCIPFAYLRYKKRPIKFAALKLLFIFTNILMNIFFFVWAPALYKSNPELVSWFYDPSYGAGYAFLANLICTSFIMLLFIPDLISVKYKFDADLLKQAYEQPYTPHFTDDASVVEALGKPVYLTEGNWENIKITTPFDLKIATALLDSCSI